MNKVMHKR